MDLGQSVRPPPNIIVWVSQAPGRPWRQVKLNGAPLQNRFRKSLHLKGATMFRVQLKCAVNGREVSLERFATVFLEEAVRRVIGDTMPKLARTEDRSSPHPSAPPKPQAMPRVVSVDETARILGLKASTIRAWIGARKISSVHLGGRVMIPMEAVDDLLARGLVPARK